MAREVDTSFNPAFQGPLEKLRAAAEAQGIHTHLISGVRSTEDQRQLYANWQAGRVGKPLPYPDRGPVPMAAKPGSSLHERGLAADLEADNPADQSRLWSLANQFGLHAIGKRDPNHFELAKGTTINAASAPVAGALANQEVGPESAGSNQAYTFALPENAPAGMRNHNPLNIKYYKGAEKDYGGLVGPSENTDQGDPQMKFSSPEAGWNAAYKLLSKKYGAGKTTPNMIIAGKGGWTPGNTQAAANVAKAAGIGPDDDIDFSNPARAQAFMRALAQQEQGGAAKAYPDAMIASAVGGTAPASGTPATTGTPATAIATAAPAAADQPWWSKFVTPPTDKEGQPIEGAKSPVEKAIGAFTGSDNLRARMEAQAPAGDGGFGQGPGARNVSPGLQNIAQTYGQTINSLMQPLTWSSGPPRIGGMAPAGSQAWAAPVSGISLNSVQAPPEGLGYGISSNYGLG